MSDGKKDMLQNNQELKKQANDLAVLGQQLSFPFGWQNWKGYADTTEQAQEQKQAPPSVIMFWGETAVGWLVTTLALSLGAPFWFDILNKFMVVRSNGETEREERDGRQQRLVIDRVSTARKIAVGTRADY